MITLLLIMKIFQSLENFEIFSIFEKVITKELEFLRLNL
jgi:hypothetical protein